MNRSMSRTQTIRAFTLIEILIVVVILGILSAIVIPQFTDASQQAMDASVRNQLQTLRGSLELYRQVEMRDPDFMVQQWTELVNMDYLTSAPLNPLNGNVDIALNPAADIGWVWRDKGNGTFMLFATDQDATVEFVE
ncbi:MAG: prepilin-type N-terminal cleavage/methylation domain-containing protein [Planctomycetota bacterium]|nr:prepilin-type N-terminal cleavage/methylation domain-containing protein [Planctomycetota bacterium]